MQIHQLLAKIIIIIFSIPLCQIRVTQKMSGVTPAIHRHMNHAHVTHQSGCDMCAFAADNLENERLGLNKS